MHNVRTRDGEDMPIQPRQVIAKPKPRRRRYRVACREETCRVQIDPMQRRRSVTPTLEKVKMLTGIHGEMHVQLAYLTAQPVHGIGSEERIDLIKDGTCLVLEHEPALQY